MPYVLPTFNIGAQWGASTVPGWPPSNAGFVPRMVAQPCALVYGHRTNAASSGGTAVAGVPIICMCLLLPPITDIRGMQDVSGFVDVVEVPQGTGRWYGVAVVDDVGKGYPNEHRTALLLALPGTWTPPYG